MIKSVVFENFKVLRKAQLPLSRLTLLVGPNGSGKSTAIEGLQMVTAGFCQKSWPGLARMLPVWTPSAASLRSRILVHWTGEFEGAVTGFAYLHESGAFEMTLKGGMNDGVGDERLKAFLRTLQVYSLDAECLAGRVTLQPHMRLERNGRGLPGVLDRLRDMAPERFEQLCDELQNWLPEYDRILFTTPEQGTRAFELRTAAGSHSIPAENLSHGTLLAVGILTIAYLPEPPRFVCFEEPDRGLHPRLLRNVQDALYRLAYPERFGDKRAATQVLVTTHSPFLLDLFRDHPEEVVIAEKSLEGGKFERLSDRGDMAEIMAGVHLGEAWFSGALGGVPKSE